jgi:hypothetical protein
LLARSGWTGAETVFGDAAGGGTKAAAMAGDDPRPPVVPRDRPDPTESLHPAPTVTAWHLREVLERSRATVKRSRETIAQSQELMIRAAGAEWGGDRV